MSDPRDYIDPEFRKFFKNPLLDFNPMTELNKVMDEMNDASEEDGEDEMFYGVVDIPQSDDYYGVANDKEEGEEIQK